METMLLTKVKNADQRSALPSTKQAKPQARMAKKKQSEISIQQWKGTVKISVSKAAKKTPAKKPTRKAAAMSRSKESVFSGEFFEFMDKMEADTKKRRVAAVEVMKKASAK